MDLTPTNTQDRIKQVLARALMIDSARITPEAHLVEDLGVTSLDRFELLMGLEEEFGIDIPEEGQESLKTVGDLSRYIDTRLAA
jgi:acyl carrier protein